MTTRWHLHGVLLDGAESGAGAERPIDLWVADGRISREPVADAVTLLRDGWLLPGLVDAHCHIGLGPDGAVDRATSERQALADRAAGVLLIRDAGSPVDTHWVDDRADLPRIVRAGRHLARPKRYLRNFAEEVEPEDLVAAVTRQAARGDGWIKLVGDWIDREQGDLAPLWPVSVATEAIERAHQLGCRVTAHVFGEQALTELLAAGVDGIEHGCGLSADTIAVMAQRQVALVPTLLQLENFPSFADAGQAKFPRYAAHMRDLYRRRFETVAAAHDAGVPIYAGTDAGGQVAHGRVADEVALLARAGGADFALGAAAWRARRWLGHPGVADGDPADLVLYDADPRLDLGVLRQPRLVILRGRPVHSP